MGFEIARRAAERGANVTLIAGPVQLQTPQGVRRVDVRDANAMRAALWQATGADLSGTDALVMAAAVADYRPTEPCATKLKRTHERVTIDLVKNPDLIAEIGVARTGGRRPVLVAFAVETDGGEALVASASRKLVEKRVDFVVANEADNSFGLDDNRATIVAAGSDRHCGRCRRGARRHHPRPRAGAPFAMNVFSTMQITVNGTLRDVPDGMTVRALVRHLGFTEGPVAVEINGAVVLRVDHVTRPVVAGDIVEIRSLRRRRLTRAQHPPYPRDDQLVVGLDEDGAPSSCAFHERRDAARREECHGDPGTLGGEGSGQHGAISVRKLQIENGASRRDGSARLARSRTLNGLRLTNGEPLGDQASPER